MVRGCICDIYSGTASPARDCPAISTTQSLTGPTAPPSSSAPKVTATNSRFIVSPEDAIEYQELKDFTRRLMRRMAEDLDTTLDWVAVDHYNTGHPHSHIVLRGKDERGADLIIAREYLSQGMRERAAEIVTLDLGPRTDREIETRLRAEVEQERFTSIDRRLLREAEQGMVRSGTVAGDSFRQTLRAGRLQKLRRLGLAEEIAPGQWKLADDLEPVLRRMGECGDIIKTTHREMAREGLARGAADLAIYDPIEPDAGRLIGRVMARGLSDELNDRHYLIVDGVDGRAHYVDLGRADTAEPLAAGSIVSLEPRPTAPRASDRTVAEIAADHGGRYSLDIHLDHDPTATAAFAETHRGAASEFDERFRARLDNQSLQLAASSAISRSSLRQWLCLPDSNSSSLPPCRSPIVRPGRWLRSDLRLSSSK
jgi:type IV secretory pathway VirD2 relaxase